MNDNWDNAWKEAVVARIKEALPNLPRVPEEKHAGPQEYRSSSRDSNRVPLEYKTEVLLI